jgi:hypothetical protein
MGNRRFLHKTILRAKPALMPALALMVASADGIPSLRGRGGPTLLPYLFAQTRHAARRQPGRPSCAGAQEECPDRREESGGSHRSRTLIFWAVRPARNPRNQEGAR